MIEKQKTTSLSNILGSKKCVPKAEIVFRLLIFRQNIGKKLMQSGKSCKHPNVVEKIPLNKTDK